MARIESMGEWEWRRSVPEGDTDDRPVPGRETVPLGGGDRATREQFGRRLRDVSRNLGEPPRGPSDPIDDDHPREENGPDACAYYLTWRQGQDWGIYVSFDCWNRITRYLWRNGIPPEIAASEAFLVLYRHERFHFKVDEATYIYEAMVASSTGLLKDHWCRFHRRYNPCETEEALANLSAFRQVGAGLSKGDQSKYRNRLRELVGTMLRSGGRGYRDFDRFRHEDVGVLLTEIMGVHIGGSIMVPEGADRLVPRERIKNDDHVFKAVFRGAQIPLYFY